MREWGGEREGRGRGEGGVREGQWTGEEGVRNGLTDGWGRARVLGEEGMREG